MECELMTDGSCRRHGRAHQEDLMKSEMLPMPPVDVITQAGINQELARRKAQAWDAHVENVQRSMAQIDSGKFLAFERSNIIEDAKGIRSLCERYGLESPF